MNLEQFIQADMKKFIKRHEPEISKELPVREEDAGIIGRVDYERHVRKALAQHRFREATKHFNEAKEKFINTPVDHKQERKHYYRILQKCYKLIYDYVEDRHKTSRLLNRLDHTADVFDEQVEAKDLEDQTDASAAMPSIEDVMFRKPQTQMPRFDEAPSISMPEQPGSELHEAKNPKDVQQPKEHKTTIDLPENPGKKEASKMPPPGRIEVPELQKPKFNPPDLELKKTSKKPEQQPKPQHTSRLSSQLKEEFPDFKTLDKPTDKKPCFEPPEMDLVKSSKRVGTQPTGKHNIQTQATQQFISQAVQLIKEDPQKAREKLIEARVEYMRSGEAQPSQLKEIETLERQLASQKAQQTYPLDAELFSSLYIKAVQAMRSGDYQTAATLLAKRIDQAPNDVAAKIRYKECTEALHGKTAR